MFNSIWKIKKAVAQPPFDRTTQIYFSWTLEPSTRDVELGQEGCLHCAKYELNIRNAVNITPLSV